MNNLIRFSLSACIFLPRIIASDVNPVAQPAHSCSEIENFLLTAKMGPLRGVSTGITGTHKLTLTSDTLQHDAHLQTVNERKTVFQGQSGIREMNFVDSYKYNIAGYELAKLLGLNMVSPHIERSVAGRMGSLSWWVDFQMIESERYEKKIGPPDPEGWNRQMYAVRVFHELIYDTDPNLTNLLITKDWQVWMIDFSRAFRLYETIREPKDLVQIDRRLLERLRQIDENGLKEKLSAWLTKSEIHALNMRRAKIVQVFDNEVKAKGEAAVLYDFPRTAQPCGLGL